MAHEISYYKQYPGFHPINIREATSWAEAIVIEGYHSGTIRTRKGEFDLTPALIFAKERRVPVFLFPGYKGTQYAGTSGVIESKKIFPIGADSLEEVLQSLQSILGETGDYDEVVKKMQERFPLTRTLFDSARPKISLQSMLRRLKI